jgi:hypothetical protein
MKRHLLLTILFLSTFVSADYLDVSLETKSNVAFDNYLFNDINKIIVKNFQVIKNCCKLR